LISRSELNADQFRAVTAPFGPALVLAGAGSGKTRTLTYRVAYLLTEGVSPEEILLLTFTNKASKQMLERVEELTGIGAHRFSVEPFIMWADKFYAYLVILSVFLEILPYLMMVILMPYLSEVIRDLDPDFFKSKENPKAKPIKGMISYARNVMVSVEEVAKGRYPSNGELLAKIDAFMREYQELKLAEDCRL
jgi:DNA helicase-2/ATP-dependent DNA helicase PcrA